MKTIKLTNGRKPILSTVVGDTKISGIMFVVVLAFSVTVVVPIVVIIVVVIVAGATVVITSSQSSHFSLRMKKTPTPIMEMQMNKSEMIRRIFLPNFSMMRVVTNVPTTPM